MSKLTIQGIPKAILQSKGVSDAGPIPGTSNVARRPSVFTKFSNDDVTNLHHLTAAAPETSANASIDPSLLNYPTNFPPQTNERKLMTSTYPPKNRGRIFASYLWCFAAGCSDAAPGALLPTIEAHYNISYSVVSLIWMSNAIGFILVAIFSHKIQPWLGKEKSIPLGCSLSVVMYAMVSSGGPFPLIVAAFFFGGMGLAIVLAQVNIFLSKMDKNSKYLSFFHGSYGVGATVSPLFATTMVERGIAWNYVYLLMLGLMFIDALVMYTVFKGADEDLSQWDNDEETDRLLNQNGTRANSGMHTPAETEAGVGLQDLSADVTSAFNRDANKQADDTKVAVVPAEDNTESANSRTATTDLKLALHNKITWNISLFTLFYQGSEVSLGGWIVTYLIDTRLAATSYGYVSSGFWGGLTFGRLVLTRPLHKALGARLTINLLLVLTIIMLILTWVVPRAITSSIFASLAGVFIGPMYPLMIASASSMLPRKIQVISLTIMTAFGSSGGAFFPFIVGLISQTSGTYVVLPICIAGYAVVLLLWLMLPNSDKRTQAPKGRLKRVFYMLW